MEVNSSRQPAGSLVKGGEKRPGANEHLSRQAVIQRDPTLFILYRENRLYRKVLPQIRTNLERCLKPYGISVALKSYPATASREDILHDLPATLKEAEGTLVVSDGTVKSAWALPETVRLSKQIHFAGVLDELFLAETQKVLFRLGDSMQAKLGERGSPDCDRASGDFMREFGRGFSYLFRLAFSQQRPDHIALVSEHLFDHPPFRLHYLKLLSDYADRTRERINPEAGSSLVDLAGSTFSRTLIAGDTLARYLARYGIDTLTLQASPVSAIKDLNSLMSLCGGAFTSHAGVYALRQAKFMSIDQKIERINEWFKINSELPNEEYVSALYALLLGEETVPAAFKSSMERCLQKRILQPQEWISQWLIDAGMPAEHVFPITRAEEREHVMELISGGSKVWLLSDRHFFTETPGSHPLMNFLESQGHSPENGANPKNPVLLKIPLENLIPDLLNSRLIDREKVPDPERTVDEVTREIAVKAVEWRRTHAFACD